MTSTRLAEIETRAEAASEGPWRNVDLRHQRGGQIRIFSRAGGIRANVLASADNAAADAEFIAHARDDVPALVVEVRHLRAAVDAALALHVPVKRYHDGAGEWSTSTPEGAADYAEIELSEVEFFEVCGHCGYMETWMHDEAEQDFEYREALWPCATARALAPVADPDPHTTSDEETT